MASTLLSGYTNFVEVSKVLSGIERSLTYQSWVKNFVSELKRDYEAKKARNPRLSLRGYAAKIGLSFGALSEIFRGKRTLSQKRALAIIENLKLEPAVHRRFLALTNAPMTLSYAAGEGDGGEFFLDADSLHILGFLSEKSFQFEVATIALKLNLSETDVQLRIDELARRGLLVMSVDGLIWRSNHPVSVRTNSSTTRAAREPLETASKYITLGDLEHYHFRSLSVQATRQQLELLKTEIDTLLENFLTRTGHDPENELIRLSLSVFPVDFSAPKES